MDQFNQSHNVLKEKTRTKNTPIKSPLVLNVEVKDTVSVFWS